MAFEDFCPLDLSGLVLFVAVAVLSFLVLNRQKDRLPPGPWWCLPVVGSLRLAGDRPTYQKLLPLWKQYGNIFMLRLGRNSSVVLASSELIKEAFLTKSGQFSSRPHMPMMIRNNRDKGIIWGSGQQWHNLRKFTLVTLKSFGVGKTSLEARIQDETAELCKVVDSHHGETFALNDAIGKAVSNIICGIIFGSRFNYDDKEFQRLLRLLNDLLRLMARLSAENAIPWMKYFRRTKSLIGQISDLNEQISDFLREAIEDHKMTFQLGNARDFIDLYLQLSADEKQNQDISEENIFQVIRDLFVAGSETTTSTMRWSLLFMIKNPKIQGKCREEIKQVAGFSRMVELSDRPRMPYVSATLNEVQRMRTIAPLGVPHAVNEDTVLAGYKIPKGSTVLPFIHAVHMDPCYWKDPEEFLPERWLGKDGELLQHESFLPFSIGPRVCLGKSLAKAELFLFFTSLLQRFTFESPDGESPSADDGEESATVQPVNYQLCATPNF